MAESRWRLDRIQRLEAAVFDLTIEAGDPNRSPDHRIAAAMLAGTGDALARLERYRAAAERSYFKAYKTLQDDRCDTSVADADLHTAKQLEKFAERIINAPAPDQPGHPRYGRFRELENEANRKLQNEPNSSSRGAAMACYTRPDAEPLKLSKELQRELALRL